MTNLAASAVALVVLVDLATGQGPPIYTNYLQQQENFRPPPPPPLLPVAHIHRTGYDAKKIDKEFEKAIELGKIGDPKERKKLEKEYEKEYAEGGREYDKKDKKEEDQSNSGMFSSLSNRMSGAWSKCLSGEEAQLQFLLFESNHTNTYPIPNREHLLIWTREKSCQRAEWKQ